MAKQKNNRSIVGQPASVASGRSTKPLPGTGMATLRMNPNFPPFDDIRVRQAIINAMDYDAIGEAVFRGLGERADSILAPAFGDFHTASHMASQDLERKRKVFSENGIAESQFDDAKSLYDLKRVNLSRFSWKVPTLPVVWNRLVAMRRSASTWTGMRYAPTWPTTPLCAHSPIRPNG